MQNSVGDSGAGGDCEILYYKAIPYAKPPVGDRRWKPAELVEPSIARHPLGQPFSASPMQMQLTDSSSFFYKDPVEVDEDCLYLNIWTPCSENHNCPGEEINKKRLPVMVWIYGGGLLVGSAADPLFDATELAKKGVVVVTFNYRLGVFGYFSHPALSAESGHHSSGNYGLTDQIAALQWVHDNIHWYGGDAMNITLFGESAGALAISQLMSSPKAKGLFHRAILQSAYLPAMPELRRSVYGMLSAEHYGETFAQSLGVASAGAQSLATLRTLPASTILQGSANFEFDKAVVDGWILPEQVFECFEQGHQHAIPVLGGFNSNEGSYLSLTGLVDIPKSAAGYVDAIKDRYGALADNYLEVYPPDDLAKAAYAPIGNGLYAWGTERLVRMMSTVEQNAYLYYLDQAPDWANKMGLGAMHSIDMLYTFEHIQRNIKGSPSWPDQEPSANDINLAEIVSNYWIAFAKTGYPAVAGQPAWPVYTNSDRAYISFSDGRAEADSHLKPALFRLHENIVGERRNNNSNWTYKNLGLLAPVIASSGA